MDKRTVLIVGGSSGVGSHLLQEFISAGYTVICTYYGHADAISNSVAKAYKLNVVNEDNVAELATEIGSAYQKLDALIYASGIFEDALTDKMQLSSWEHVLDINLTGAFLVTKHMLPLLRESGDGRIIYIGSVMGETGCYGSISYSVTKAGLIALAKTVALENAKKHVTANVLSLGYIDTGMTARVPDKVLDSAMKKIPMQRLGNPSDVGKIAVDLCSEHMNYVSGQVIRINGALYV